MNRSGFAALIVGFLASAGPAIADAPHPPCGTGPVAEYARPGEDPRVKLWTGSDLDPVWTPPACTPWQAGAASIVVELAGRFRSERGADALLARIGAISSLTAVRYWSVNDKQWNAMFTRAVALDGPVSRRQRGDFSAAELRAGGDFYFIAADYRSGKDAMSRLHVVAADGAHIALETENVAPLRWSFLTYAAPGKFQTWYFLDREAGDSWRFYSLTRVLYAAPLFAHIIPEKSYINRSVAMYRHFLALPTDREPPPAP